MRGWLEEAPLVFWRINFGAAKTNLYIILPHIAPRAINLSAATLEGGNALPQGP